jgi:hypothetical protein
MTALNIHLNELLAVLRASAGLDPTGRLPIRLREEIVDRLAWTDPLLADRVRRLDDWHTEALAQLVADAHELADALDGQAGPQTDESADTRSFG